MNESTDRLAGLLGVIWAVAILVVTFAAGAPPDVDGAPGDIRDYLLDNREIWMATGVVEALTLPLLLSLFLSLMARTRVVSATGRTATTATLAGLGLGIAFLLLPLVFILPLCVDQSLGKSVSDDLLQVLWASAFASTMFSNVGFGIALSGVASAGEGSPVITPLRWAAGLVGAILLLVSAIGLANNDVAMQAGAGIALVCLWVAAAGIQLMVERQAPVAQQATGV